MSNAVAPPLQTPLIESAKTGLMTRVWYLWLISWITRLQQSAYVAVSLALTAQTAAIGTTALITLAAAGVYRVSAVARVTTAASVSSTLTPTVSYTRSASSCSQPGAAMTSNALTLPMSWVFLIKVDTSTPISFSTAYGSVGGTSMIYELDWTVERVV